MYPYDWTGKVRRVWRGAERAAIAVPGWCLSDLIAARRNKAFPSTDMPLRVILKGIGLD